MKKVITSRRILQRSRCVVPFMTVISRFIVFWAAAPKGTKSCRILGTYVYLSVCLFICLFVCSFVHLFIRLFICLFVRSFVCPQALSGLKSALSGLKSALSGLKSALSGLKFALSGLKPVLSGPKLADFRPERPGGDRWMNKRTNKRTN